MHSGMPRVLVFINEIHLDNVPFTSVFWLWNPNFRISTSTEV